MHCEPAEESQDVTDSKSNDKEEKKNENRSLHFTSSIEKVKDYGWYWGPLSSEAAEKVLSNEPDGSFIVRDSSDDHYIFSLSFKLNNCVRHVRIEQDQGTFSFGSYAKFKSQTITEFIEKAVEHSRSGRYLFFLHRRPEHGPMRVQLTNPVSRFKHVQSLQHMCRFVILKAVVRKDLIQTLPLPRRLLDYLNYKHCYSEQVESDSSNSQDPAIQQATRTVTNVQNSLEDYNPFEQEQSKPQLQINSTNNAAVVQPLSQNIPPTQQRVATTATPSTSVQITTEELQRRQEELDRKAAELDRREQQLQGNIPQLNNWPPLPDNFCVKPCFYQDFNLEIPPEFQRLVKHLYYTWMFYTLTMCLNIIGGLIILLHSKQFTYFGLAIFYTLLFTPASYICWFRPAYKAFRNDSSFNFMVFFFVYFFQTIFSIFQAIGFYDSGYCGFIVAISMFDSSASGIIVGLLLLCIAFCFAAVAAANILMITKIHSIYRSTGASMAKAQAEFATEFMRNQHVQEAASSAVNSAVNSQFNNRRY